MTDRKIIPDMSTPEGITEAFEHIREHSTEPQEVTRGLTLEVLRLLQEAEVGDAVTLEEELKRTKQGSGEPLYGNIGEVGDVYEEARGVKTDPEEEANLRRLEGVAHAVADITSAMFAGAAGNGDNAAATLKDRSEALEKIGGSEEARDARVAVSGIIGNMFTVLPVSKDQ
jgi:hypothetical protein